MSIPTSPRHLPTPSSAPVPALASAASPRDFVIAPDPVLHRGHELVVRWSPDLAARNAAAAGTLVVADAEAAAVKDAAALASAAAAQLPPALSLLQSRAAALADLTVPLQTKQVLSLPGVSTLPVTMSPRPPLPASVSPAPAQPLSKREFAGKRAVPVPVPKQSRLPLHASSSLRAYTRGAWLVDSSTQTSDETRTAVIAPQSPSLLSPASGNAAATTIRRARTSDAALSRSDVSSSTADPVAKTAASTKARVLSGYTAATDASPAVLSIHCLMRELDGAEAARAAKSALATIFSTASANDSIGGSSSRSDAAEIAEYLREESNTSGLLFSGLNYGDRTDAYVNAGVGQAATEEDMSELRCRIEALVDSQPRLFAQSSPAPLPSGALSAWLDASAQATQSLRVGNSAGIENGDFLTSGGVVGGAQASGDAARASSACSSASDLSACLAGQLTAAWEDVEEAASTTPDAAHVSLVE